MLLGADPTAQNSRDLRVQVATVGGTVVDGMTTG